MNNLVPDHVEIIGENLWALKNDKSLTPVARIIGTICIETELARAIASLNLSPGSIVVDVGAYIGDTALMFQNIGCTVYAVEPFYDAYECLVHNTKAIAFNRAAGDGRMVELNESCDHGNLGTRSVNVDNPPNPDLHTTLMLDSLNLKRVDLIKLDAEGFEPAVLRGFWETITLCKPPILCEVYDTMLKKHGFNRSDIFQPLRDIGYRSKVVVGRIEEDRCDVLFSIPTP